jgi:ribosome-binding ATPase YchF (GTP1/OBG family)
MKLGIIGLPNAGKTTLFNALTGQELEITSYPNPASADAPVGVIKVPDARIDRLSEIYKPKKTTYAEVQCTDVTGFDRGISGSGQKGSLFDMAWDADALIHVVRAFEDESIVHEGPIDPAADAAALDLELIFHDLELVETRLERIESSMKKGVGEGLEVERQALERCSEALEVERPLRGLELSGEERAAIGSLQFVSLKPELVVLDRQRADAGCGRRPQRLLRRQAGAGVRLKRQDRDGTLPAGAGGGGDVPGGAGHRRAGHEPGHPRGLRTTGAHLLLHRGRG